MYNFFICLTYFNGILFDLAQTKNNYQEAANALMKELDKNQDGKVSLDEFVKVKMDAF